MHRDSHSVPPQSVPGAHVFPHGGIAAACAAKRALASQLREVLDTLALPRESALVGVGGYAKQTITPTSDLDVFLLLPNSALDPASIDAFFKALQQELGRPVKRYPSTTVLGWSRIVGDHVIFGSDLCFSEFIAGNRALYDALAAQVTPLANSRQQLERYLLWNVIYRREQNASGDRISALDPKYGRGGFRDFILLFALAKRLLGCTASNPEALIDALAQAGWISSGQAEELLVTYDLKLALAFAARAHEGSAANSMSQRLSVTGMGLSEYQQNLERVHRISLDLHDAIISWIRSNHDGEWRSLFDRVSPTLGLAGQHHVIEACRRMPFEDADPLLLLLARMTREPAVTAALESWQDRSWLIRAALAMNPATAPTTLADFIKRPGELEEDVRLFAARNKSTPPGDLSWLRDNVDFPATARESAARTLQMLEAAK